MKHHLTLYCSIFLMAIISSLYGQEPFDFDDETENAELFKIDIAGDCSIGGTFFFNQPKHFAEIKPSSLIQTNVSLCAESPFTKAYFGVRLNDKTLSTGLGEQQKTFPQNKQIPSWIDESYLDIILDSLVFSGGIQKLSWGRTETASVLDIVNPLDNTDFTIDTLQEKKIARPLFRLQFYAPFDLKCESIFLPNFEGHHFALDGKWKASEIHRIEQTIKHTQPHTDTFIMPHDTATLQHAQGGARLTGTIATVHDFGVQYFYGRLREAAVYIDETQHTPTVVYNPYHHIGADYGTILGPVGIQIECAANITEDIAGNNPFVYNPFFSWNTTIEFNAPFALNFTAAVAEHITLNHSRIGEKQYDIQKGQKQTDTKAVFSIAQSLLRNSFEWRINTTIGIEDADFCIRPGIHWQYGTILINCHYALFGGSRTGKQGRFYNNNCVSLSFGYAF